MINIIEGKEFKYLIDIIDNLINLENVNIYIHNKYKCSQIKENNIYIKNDKNTINNIVEKCIEYKLKKYKSNRNKALIYFVKEYFYNLIILYLFYREKTDGLEILADEYINKLFKQVYLENVLSYFAKILVIKTILNENGNHTKDKKINYYFNSDSLCNTFNQLNLDEFKEKYSEIKEGFIKFLLKMESDYCV